MIVFRRRVPQAGEWPMHFLASTDLIAREMSRFPEWDTLAMARSFRHTRKVLSPHRAEIEAAATAKGGGEPRV